MSSAGAHPPFEPGPKASTLAGSMPLDLAAVEAVSALEQHAGGAILLKGSSFARWLYDSPGERFYGDVDVLCPEQSLGADALRSLGYSPVSMHPLGINSVWVRDGDGVTVDLHNSLVGINSDPTTVWSVLSKHVVRFTLLGAAVPILDEPARTMHVALHSAGHGDASGPLDDLERAVARVDDEAWRDAWSIARDLSAEDAFSAGLWLSARGAEVALRLGIPRCRSVGVELRARSATDAAQVLGLISDANGIRNKLAVLRNSLFPRGGAPPDPSTERRVWASTLATKTKRVVVTLYGAIKAVPVWWTVQRTVAKRDTGRASD